MLPVPLNSVKSHWCFVTKCSTVSPSATNLRGSGAGSSVYELILLIRKFNLFAMETAVSRRRAREWSRLFPSTRHNIATSSPAAIGLIPSQNAWNIYFSVDDILEACGRTNFGFLLYLIVVKAQVISEGTSGFCWLVKTEPRIAIVSLFRDVSPLLWGNCLGKLEAH